MPKPRNIANFCADWIVTKENKTYCTEITLLDNAGNTRYKREGIQGKVQEPAEIIIENNLGPERFDKIYLIIKPDSRRSFLYRKYYNHPNVILIENYKKLVIPENEKALIVIDRPVCDMVNPDSFAQTGHGEAIRELDQFNFFERVTNYFDEHPINATLWNHKGCIQMINDKFLFHHLLKGAPQIPQTLIVSSKTKHSLEALQDFSSSHLIFKLSNCSEATGTFVIEKGLALKVISLIQTLMTNQDEDFTASINSLGIDNDAAKQIKVMIDHLRSNTRSPTFIVQEYLELKVITGKKHSDYRVAFSIDLDDFTVWVNHITWQGPKTPGESRTSQVSNSAAKNKMEMDFELVEGELFEWLSKETEPLHQIAVKVFTQFTKEQLFRNLQEEGGEYAFESYMAFFASPTYFSPQKSLELTRHYAPEAILIPLLVNCREKLKTLDLVTAHYVLPDLIAELANQDLNFLVSLRKPMRALLVDYVVDLMFYANRLAKMLCITATRLHHLVLIKLYLKLFEIQNGEPSLETARQFDAGFKRQQDWEESSGYNSIDKSMQNASAFIHKGEYSKALELLPIIVSISKKKQDLGELEGLGLLMQADCYFKLDDQAQAKSLLYQVLAWLSPFKDLPLFQEALLLRLHQLSKETQFNFTFLVNQGYEKIKSDPNEAVRDLTVAVNLKPISSLANMASAYFRLGLALKASLQIDNARKAFTISRDIYQYLEEKTLIRSCEKQLEVCTLTTSPHVNREDLQLKILQMLYTQAQTAYVRKQFDVAFKGFSALSHRTFSHSPNPEQALIILRCLLRVSRMIYDRESSLMNSVELKYIEEKSIAMLASVRTIRDPLSLVLHQANEIFSAIQDILRLIAQDKILAEATNAMRALLGVDSNLASLMQFFPNSAEVLASHTPETMTKELTNILSELKKY